MRDYVNGADWPNRKLDGYADITETGTVPGAANEYTVELDQRIVPNGTLVVVCGGDTLTVVPYGSAVAVGQVGVSYELPLVQVNSAREGETLSVEYTPGGGVLSSAVKSEMADADHEHDGADITYGTVADERLSANVPLKNAATSAFTGNVSATYFRATTAGGFSSTGTVLDFDFIGLPANSSPQIRIGRGVNTGTGTLVTYWNKGDGTSAVTMSLNHKTGQLNPTILAIGGGTAITKVTSVTATVTFTAIAADAVQEQTITVSGAALGNIAVANPTVAWTAGIVWSSYVSAAGVVTIRAHNGTGASITPAAVTWRAMVTAF